MKKQFNILDYGAVADGVTNNALAIQHAIDDASLQGGQVIIPAGRYLSGTIRLKSNIDFHLSKGAVLISSLNEQEIDSFEKLFQIEHFEWEGGCFLFAYNEENITISGEGIIYGQGDQVFFDDNADNGAHECPLSVAQFRPRTSFFEHVVNLTIKDITIKNAAFWTLHMAGCKHVRIQGIHIDNDVRGANNDGIDPDSCQDVIISQCIITTGDDAIVVKTTKPMTQKYGACENIIIDHCILASRDSALKIGTETWGDIRNIIFSDCIIKDCSRGVGIWVRDGATIENIHMHHITGNVLKYADGVRKEGPTMWWGNGEPIFINATYRQGRDNYPGCIRNIKADHITMKVESSLFVAGEAAARISKIKLTDLDLTMCKQGTQTFGYFDEQPSNRNVYSHSIPVVYARCVDGLQVNGEVSFVEPYSPDVNRIYEEDDCTGSNVDMAVIEI